jgi:hypothetical protein
MLVSEGDWWDRVLKSEWFPGTSSICKKFSFATKDLQGDMWLPPLHALHVGPHLSNGMFVECASLTSVCGVEKCCINNVHVDCVPIGFRAYHIL